MKSEIIITNCGRAMPRQSNTIYRWVYPHLDLQLLEELYILVSNWEIETSTLHIYNFRSDKEAQMWIRLICGKRLMSGLTLLLYEPDPHSEHTDADVIKWKHFPHNWSFVRGIHRSPVNSPHKGQWRRALMFSLVCALNIRLSKQSWGWWL